MIAALLIVAGWGAFLALTMVWFMGAHHGPAPKPPITQEQRIWFKAAARVAARKIA